MRKSKPVGCLTHQHDIWKNLFLFGTSTNLRIQYRSDPWRGSKALHCHIRYFFHFSGLNIVRSSFAVGQALTVTATWCPATCSLHRCWRRFVLVTSTTCTTCTTCTVQEVGHQYHCRLPVARCWTIHWYYQACKEMCALCSIVFSKVAGYQLLPW